jgi:hypothetical protein
MRHSSLDDEVGLDPQDDLLHRDDVVRKLDDRTAEPGEVVRVAVLRQRHVELSA